MSALQEAKKSMLQYATARIPLVTIHSIEIARVLNMLGEVSEEKEIPYFVHTSTKGVYDLKTKKSATDDKSLYSALEFITEQMSRRSNLTIVFTELPDLSTENSDSRAFLALVNLANETGGQIILLTTNTLWNTLQRQGMLIDVALPDEEEMYEIINRVLNDYRSSIFVEWDDSDVKEAAMALAGVSQVEAENVLVSLIAKREVLKSDLVEIRYAKDKLFSDISGLEKIVVDPSVKNVGGLAGLQKWLDEKKSLMTPEKREFLRAMGLQPPRGILLVGVPGCGKSLSAKSISANWELPLYRLDFATVQGSYVGQTEQQLKDALTTAENVAPCILWIDEIEKGLSGATGPSGDGGVSTRMVGQFLFWLQECKKPVFVVATANDVSMLPSELLRRGRFDELFFGDLPTADERRDILTLYMRKYLRVNFTGKFADQIVDITDGFTGADLESTVRDLAYRKLANSEFRLDAKNIVEAFENVVPLSQTSPEKIEAIRNWGKEKAVPASGKPIGDSVLSEKKGERRRKVLI